jgi:dienelactone hydrolase
MHGGEGYAADGMLFTPKGDPPFAAIVLIPDERGITGRLNEAVSRFSERGFLVIALDLNRGLAPDAATHAEADALHDIDATLTFLQSQSSVRHEAVGLMGWQSGGVYAMKFAADSRVKALLTIDAAPNTIEAGKTQTPVLAAFAGHGPHGNAASIKSYEMLAKQHGLRPTTKIYPQADVDFDDPDNAAHYRSKDAAELGTLEVNFFAKHLTPSTPREK